MPWKKGQSGNPAGRPRETDDVKLLARQYTTQAIEALAKALEDPKSRVHAAIALLDRGWGKPTQPQEHSDGLDLSGLSTAELQRELDELRRKRAIAETGAPEQPDDGPLKH